MVDGGIRIVWLLVEVVEAQGATAIRTLALRWLVERYHSQLELGELAELVLQRTEQAVRLHHSQE